MEAAVTSDPARTEAHPQRAEALPQRSGDRPRTTGATPHVQLDQHAPQVLQDELWRRIAELEGVRTGASGISEARSRALHLDDSAQGPREAFLVNTEFAHLHGDGSGSLHLTLPRARAAEAVRQGWGEEHPVVALGLAAPTLLMVYGPRTLDEFAVVLRLVEESHAFGRTEAGAA
jgi:hypothetical protein